MSEHNPSFTERWMEQYEAKHPEVLRQVRQRDHDSSLALKPVIPAQQSKTGGNTCLWNTLSNTSTCEAHQRVIEPVVLAAIQARKSLKLTQAAFARCLGLSPRTVSEWEQGRRKPSGAARTLLQWVVKHPDYLKEALKAL